MDKGMEVARARVQTGARRVLRNAGNDDIPALLPEEETLLRAIVDSSNEAEVDAAYAAMVDRTPANATAWFPPEYHVFMFRCLLFCCSTTVALQVCDSMLEGMAQNHNDWTMQRLGCTYQFLWDMAMDMQTIFRRVAVARRIMESAFVYDLGHRHRWLLRCNIPKRYGAALKTLLTTPSENDAEQTERAAFVRWLLGAVVWEPLITSTPWLPELLQAFVTAGPLGLDAAACAAFIAEHRRRCTCTLC
jgi:hypothetical protein